MVNYQLQFVESYSDPLSEVEDDTMAVGYDLSNQLSEMRGVTGPDTIEYGGSQPWTHHWEGYIKPREIHQYIISQWVDEDELPENWATTLFDHLDNEAVREVIAQEVDSLMTFIGESETPNGQSPSDYEWTVTVENPSHSRLRSGVYLLHIHWEHEEHL